MYVYKFVVLFLLAAITVVYTNCGSPFTSQSQLVWKSNIATFAGSQEAFEATVYPITQARCVSCHQVQSPQHASSDVAVAHDAAFTKVNFGNIPNSRLVRKLRDEAHNCWGDCQANADEMEAAIEEWYAAIQDADEQSPTPVIPPPAQTLRTAQSLTIAQELASTANPSKSNTVEVMTGGAMVSAPMVKTSDAFGDFIHVPDNDGQNLTLAATDASAGIALMNLRLPAAGTYRVWAYLLNPNANTNAVFVGLSPMGTQNYIGNLRTVDNITQNANPMWRQLSNTFAVPSAGNYTLTIRERKDGLKIYRIFVTADAGFNGSDVASYLGVTLSYDISGIVNSPNVSFRIDVTDYDMYTYLLANPRIVTPTRNIRVKNVRPMINNIWNPQNSAYTTVDKIVTPTDQSVSGFNLSVLKDQGASMDRIHFEFEILEIYSGAVNNASLTAFQNSVYPISRTNCASCHSAQRPHASPDPLTAHDYALTIVNLNTPANSLIVTKIRNGHQGISAAQGASIASQYEAAIAQWRTGRGP